MLHHHRLDKPRRNPKTGKIIKYEFPARSAMCLDVHPHIREQIRDPKIPLWVTEGIKKAQVPQVLEPPRIWPAHDTILKCEFWVVADFGRRCSL